MRRGHRDLNHLGALMQITKTIILATLNEVALLALLNSDDLREGLRLSSTNAAITLPTPANLAIRRLPAFVTQWRAGDSAPGETTDLGVVPRV